MKVLLIASLATSALIAAPAQAAIDSGSVPGSTSSSLTFVMSTAMRRQVTPAGRAGLRISFRQVEPLPWDVPLMEAATPLRHPHVKVIGDRLAIDAE